MPRRRTDTRTALDAPPDMADVERDVRAKKPRVGGPSTPLFTRPDAPPGAARPELGPASTRVDAPERAQIIEAGRHSYESLIALCRNDVNAFNEFVLRDEQTGAEIEQDEIHVEMHATLDAEQYVVVMSFPESGKTQQIAVGRTLFKLGKNPALRSAFLGNTQDAAKKNLVPVKAYIEKSPELRAVFPKLLPGALWRDDAITIERDSTAKDPSIQCLGYKGNILGSRVDWGVVDDYLDNENTRTDAQRRESLKWLLSNAFMGRLTDEAEVAFLTNAWHEEDAAHQLEELGWATLRYPVLDSDGTSRWPNRWPLRRIAKRRAKIGELEFARSFLCKPRDAGMEIFAPEWMRWCLKRGVGYGALGFLDPELAQRGIVVTGFDLGASRKARGGVSSLQTLFVHPGGDRQWLAGRSGRWSGGDLLRNIAEAGVRYGGVVVVEDNGTQRHIVELAQEHGEHFQIPVPVLPFTTGKNKIDPQLGIEAMAVEFESKRWILPSGRRGKEIPPALKLLMSDMKNFTPGEHPGDHLMAAWFARTWALMMLLRKKRGERPHGGIRATVLGSDARAA